MKYRKLMFGLIIAFCIFAVISAIYEQIELSSQKDKVDTSTILENQKSQETLKREFNALFNNAISLNNYDTSKIQKIDSSKEIVYSAYDIQRNEENKYEVDIHLPVVNINNETASKFNQSTQTIFADKATEVLSNENDYTIVYNVTYTGFVNGDILSLIIKSTLKEGTNAQRTIVQTYNYNLETEKEVTINDAIVAVGADSAKVTDKIKAIINQAIKEATSIQVSGYATFQRDINSDIYKLENVDTFYIEPDSKLYIIFAYGNNDFTSEMDIIDI